MTRDVCHPRQIDMLIKPSHVTDGVGAATVCPLGIVVHMRHMVIEQKSVESGLLEGDHDTAGIVVAFADEAFLECRTVPGRRGSGHRGLARGRNARPFDHVCRASGHFRAATQAEIDAPGGAVGQLGSALER